eukprot:1188740-Prorocentrum_minimum.AAC.2
MRICVVAKDDLTHRKLCEQFAARTVKRSYVALTCGVPKGESPGEGRKGRVVAHIGRSSRDRKSMAVVEEGRGRFAASK